MLSNGQQDLMLVKLDDALCRGEKTYCESQVGITRMCIFIHLHTFQKTCLRVQVQMHAYISAPMTALSIII